MHIKKYFETHLEQFKQGLNNQATALCPLHSDTNPSFSCNTETGLSCCHNPACGWKGSFDQFVQQLAILKTKSQANFIAYNYFLPDGKLQYQIRRYFPKKIMVFHLQESEWVSGLGNKNKILYNQIGIEKEDVVFIVEGEKDADTLIKHSIPATTNPFGAGRWKDEYSTIFKNKSVIVIPDQDEPGIKHAQSVAKSVAHYATEVKILNLPRGKDVSEWFENEGCADKFLNLLDDESNVENVEKPTLTELKNLSQKTTKDWPTISVVAFHGLVGEIVKTIEPHTEADPIAILVNLLTAFGNCIGNKPHFKVEHSKHAYKLFACLIGRSSKGRKGTSWSVIEHLFSIADPLWKSKIIKSGLSSGEGLINHVVDKEKEDTFKIGESNNSEDQNEVKEAIYNSETVSTEDKRILVIEEEFATPLKRMAMDSNSLSGVLRNAWDSDTLRVVTKHNPLCASNTHISFIGHTTIFDLMKYLKQTEMANGFGNRFIWLLSKRSKTLPNPKGTPEGKLIYLATKLSEALRHAEKSEEIVRSKEAESLWAELYEDLSKERYGLTGSLLTRAEAQVMRIAGIYALMDSESLVDVCHLQAALAVWEYCEASTKYVFGDKVGDPIADSIFEALKQKGSLSKEEINQLFSNNRSAIERSRATELLMTCGLIEESVIKETDGAPKTLYSLKEESK